MVPLTALVGLLVIGMCQSSDRDAAVRDFRARLLQRLDLSPPGPGQEPPQEVFEVAQEGELSLMPVHRNDVLIPADNKNLTCHRISDDKCRRYEFTTSASLDSVLSVHIWIRKIHRERSLSLSVFHTGMDSPVIALREDPLTQTSRNGWVSFQLPKSLALEHIDGRLFCAVEITGCEVHEDRVFAVVSDAERAARSRRSVPGQDGCTCCTDEYRVSIEELGLQDWVKAPKKIPIRVCRGVCAHSIAAFTLHYQSMLGFFYSKNPGLSRPDCRFWANSCRPRRTTTLRLMYRTSNNTYLDRHLDNMLIESCGCSSCS